MDAPKDFPTARERIVVALRHSELIGKGMLPHVEQMVWAMSDGEFKFYGLALFFA